MKFIKCKNIEGGEKVKYIDEEDIRAKINEEITRMKENLEHIETEAEEGNWDLEAEIEEEVIEIEKTIAVIDYLKSQI